MSRVIRNLTIFGLNDYCIATILHIGELLSFVKITHNIRYMKYEVYARPPPHLVILKNH